MEDHNQENKSQPLHKVAEYKNLRKMKILLPSTNDINEKNEKGLTVLHIACDEAKNDEILELLLNVKDIDIAITNNDGFVPLHYLAFRGNLSGIKLLFTYFPDAEVDPLTDDQDTPLIMASKRDHADIIEYLYEKGANIDHANNKGYTAIRYAANNGYMRSTETLLKLDAKITVKDDYGLTPLMKACQWGFTEVAELLIKHGADVNDRDSWKQTALLHACLKGHLQVCQLLLENNADPNLTGFQQHENNTRTALMNACFNDNLAIVKLLVKYGADVNFPGPYSLALSTCAWTGSLKCAEYLLQNGVSPSGRNYKDKTEADIERKCNQDYNSLTPLMKTCQRGFTEVAELLIKHGADVNDRDNWKQTALLHACREGHLQVCQLLLENKADPNLTGFFQPENNTSTALMKACFNDNLELVKLLVKYGADVNFPGPYSLALFTCARKGSLKCAEYLLQMGVSPSGRNYKDKTAADIERKCNHDDYSLTPLIKACQLGFTEVAELLIKHGADVNDRDSWNQTAIIYACRQGHLQVCNLLLENKADPNLTGFFQHENNTSTALMNACFNDNLELVKLLVKYGADVNFPGPYSLALLTCAWTASLQCAEYLLQMGVSPSGRNYKDKTTADIERKCNHDDYPLTPLIKACQLGFTEVAELLIKHGADVNDRDSWKQTALLYACLKGHLQVCQLLLENNADPNLTGFSQNENNTRTALTNASFNDNLAIVKLLVKYGADIHFPGPFSLALFTCARRGSLKCAEYLLQNGVSPSGRNRKGKTAADIARECNQYDILELLRDYS